MGKIREPGSFWAWPAALLLLLIPAAMAGLFLSPSAGSPAAAARPTEHEVKAAFIYNFARFTQWPVGCFEDSSTPLVIGIIGSDPVGTALEAAVVNRKVGGRAVVIVRLRPNEPICCHLLYVAGSERAHLPQLLAAVGDSPVLTVCDVLDAGPRRAMITFRVLENQVRFEINLRDVERSRLALSSQLIRLAINVRTGSERR